MDRGDEVRSFVMPRSWKKKHCLLLSFVILFASPILCTIMAKKRNTESEHSGTTINGLTFLLQSNMRSLFGYIVHIVLDINNTNE